jgi:hypothetical protein
MATKIKDLAKRAVKQAPAAVQTHDNLYSYLPNKALRQMTRIREFAAYLKNARFSVYLTKCSIPNGRIPNILKKEV